MPTGYIDFAAATSDLVTEILGKPAQLHYSTFAPSQEAKTVVKPKLSLKNTIFRVGFENETKTGRCKNSQKNVN